VSGRIRHALIMAAGRGLRMGPLTDVVPKPMAPYLNSSLIAVGIGKLRPQIERIHVTVGYKGAMLAQHLIERGVDSVFNTDGHGNAWWLHHTVMAAIDEPVLVLTCDNVTDLDVTSLAEDYDEAGAPPCLIVPVRPVDGVEGDYIEHAGRVVTWIGRARATGSYASGVQILNPARIHRECPDHDSFYEVWNALVARGGLRVSRVQPASWFSVDTLSDLQRLRR
jgi:NDP-sugar pyrophosphorylase family protein